MVLYHGSDTIIKNPVSDGGRIDVDFGIGFYLTQDKRMAQKWACNKTKSILNIYKADISELKIKNLKANEEWLDYVIYNRTHEGSLSFNDTQYDIIIGPTADDKLFATIDLYSDGVISKKQNLFNQMVEDRKMASRRANELMRQGR